MSSTRKKSPSKVMEMIRNALTGSRTNWLNKLTDQKRDLESEFGHPQLVGIDDYCRMFDRGDIASRIISIYPEECFSEAPLVYETEDDVETEFEKEWNMLNDQMHLTSMLLRADILSGIGRYGVILLGIDDGASLEQPIAGFDPFPSQTNTGLKPINNITLTPLNPLPPGVAAFDAPGQRTPPEPVPIPASPDFKPKRNLLYLRTFDESLVKIIRLENDPNNPRFGQPVLYELTLWKDNVGEDGTSLSDLPPPSSGINKIDPNIANRSSLRVHWHRIIHLADNRLRDEIFGTPRLKKVYNRVLDLHKVAGSSPEMYYKGAFMGMALETHPSDEPVAIDKQATKDELEEYYEGLKRYFTLEGMTANPIAPQVADPGPAADLQIKLIAISLSCPMRIFMGAEVGALASGQDIVAWNGRLAKRREEYLSPYVIRPFVDRLIGIGVLPFPMGGDAAPETGNNPRPVYIVFWSDLNTPSTGEQADVAVKRTAAMTQYVSGGVDQIISPRHFLELVVGFTRDETEAIIDEVGDRMIQTDPALEHQHALEKIQAAADIPALPAPNPNGTPAFRSVGAAAVN